MEVKKEQQQQWTVISLNGKMDCFNFEEVTTKIDDLVGDWNKKVAFDLSHTNFLNFASIQFLAKRAKEAKSRGGELAVVSASMKTKRHIEIFGSLDNITVFDRSVEFLKASTEVDSSGDHA